MRRHASTVALVVLAVALGVWLWLDRDRVSSSEQKQRKDNVFVVWRKEELSAITLVHEGETLALERRGADWQLTSPRRERADPQAVDRLLGALELATVQRRVSTASGLGLEAPRATGQLTMGGLTTRFVLGGASPKPEGSSYLRVDDGAPVVVGKDVEAALLAPADTYRDRTVVPYLVTELQGFEVQVEHGGGFAVTRRDERSFLVGGVLASRSALDGVWAALADLRAEAFPKDADAELLTRTPRMTVTMVPKDPKAPRAVLVVGGACPDHPDDVVVLRKEPTRVAACAARDILPRLDLGPEAIVEHRPFTFHADEVEELRLERLGDVGKSVDPAAPARLEIARKGNGFHERFPADRDVSAAEADAASELLSRIASTGGAAVVRPDGNAPFRAMARARLDGGDHEETVEVGAVDARGGAMLHRLVDGARLEASPALVRLLLPRLTTLRPHAIVPDEARRATRVILRCGVAQELADDGEGFRYVSPARLPADGAVGQLVDAILRGRLAPWVADADDGTFGFTPDGCRVVLAFADGKAPLTVWFGSELPGAAPAPSYAQVDAQPGVFEAPAALRELAGRLFVSRGALRVEAARVEHVRVTLHGKPLAREESALRAAVAGLYADRVVALGRKETRPPDLLVDVILGDGGPPRRIACRAAEAAGEHVCTTPDVDATFALADARLAPFLEPEDAGAVARDGGAR
ncbi:MAG: hypothetical protein JWP97_6313 [Labilithrix sp.]|nr:hypothetical protein [Labilithrix sp.]